MGTAPQGSVSGFSSAVGMEIGVPHTRCDAVGLRPLSATGLGCVCVCVCPASSLPYAVKEGSVPRPLPPVRASGCPGMKGLFRRASALGLRQETGAGGGAARSRAHNAGLCPTPGGDPLALRACGLHPIPGAPQNAAAPGPVGAAGIIAA